MAEQDMDAKKVGKRGRNGYKWSNFRQNKGKITIKDKANRTGPKKWMKIINNYPSDAL